MLLQGARCKNGCFHGVLGVQSDGSIHCTGSALVARAYKEYGEHGLDWALLGGTGLNWTHTTAFCIRSGMPSKVVSASEWKSKHSRSIMA